MQNMVIEAGLNMRMAENLSDMEKGKTGKLRKK